MLDPLRQSRIRDAIKGLIPCLTDRKADAVLGADLPHSWRDAPQPLTILCVAGRGQTVLKPPPTLTLNMLNKYGIASQVVASDETSAPNIPELSCQGWR